MYPPNYIDQECGVIISRQDAMRGRLDKILSQNVQSTYYEVDGNHPKYGKGKWGFPNFVVEGILYKGRALYDMLDNDSPPGGNSIYGTNVFPNKTPGVDLVFCWTTMEAGYYYNTGTGIYGYGYWGIRPSASRTYDINSVRTLPNSPQSGDIQITSYLNIFHSGSARFIIMY